MTEDIDERDVTPSRSVEDLLAMLVADVSREEFDGAVARASTPTSSGNGATPRELELVGELRVELDRHRRRSHELRALFETAGDLSSLRDVETVLQAIARRSRQLLETDVAYLMLIDEECGDTYMRVTDGTVMPEFATIRLPLGVGLGGLVAETGSPRWTSDYVADRRYVHGIDDIVMAENLVGILGVPLRVGQRLIGVLFAADRQTRTFSQDQILLLSSLADHAAIAIENASLFQDTANAMGEIAAAKQVMEDSNRRLQASIDVHERLMSLVLNGRSILDVAQALAETVVGSLIIFDSGARELARVGDDLPHGRTLLWNDPGWVETDEFSDLMARAERQRRAFRIESGRGDYRAVPIAARDDFFGVIIFASDQTSDFDMSMLQWAATVMALLVLSSRVQDEVENRVREELLIELLASRTQDRAGLVRRARLLGVDLDDDWVVVVAQPASRVVSPSLRSRSTMLASTLHALVAIRVDHVVLLVPGTDAEALAASTAAELNRLSDTAVTVGASGPEADLAAVAAMEEQATACARAMEVLGRQGLGGTAKQLGVYALLLAAAGQPQFRSWIDSTLGPVLSYDREHGTSLLETLNVYFEHDGRVAAAASALYLHPNTLYQRLGRLDKILGGGWRSGDLALEVRLALRLHRL